MVWEFASHFTQLHCTCKNGDEHVLEVRVEGVPDPEGDAWFYYARPSAAQYRGSKEYFASFKKIDASLLQVEALKNELPQRYRGCCITCALIPQVAAAHRARIRSSRSLAHGELRTEAATRTWERMVREGTASFEPTEDRFHHPPLTKRDA